MLSDGLAGTWRWNYSGGAVCHAPEDRMVSVSWPLLEAVGPSASWNPPAHNTGGRASHTHGAKVGQRSCIIVYVYHAPILELI